jgi:predicted deacetylase
MYEKAWVADFEPDELMNFIRLQAQLNGRACETSNVKFGALSYSWYPNSRRETWWINRKGNLTGAADAVATKTVREYLIDTMQMRQGLREGHAA